MSDVIPGIECGMERKASDRRECCCIFCKSTQDRRRGNEVWPRSSNARELSHRLTSLLYCRIHTQVLRLLRLPRERTVTVLRVGGGYLIISMDSGGAQLVEDTELDRARQNKRYRPQLQPIVSLRDLVTHSCSPVRAH